MSLSRGLGSFPDALAAKVDVKLESPVQSIEVRDDGVVVQLSGEQMRADHVVLAATAPIASRLYPGGDGVERRLMTTEYPPPATTPPPPTPHRPYPPSP